MQVTTTHSIYTYLRLFLNQVSLLFHHFRHKKQVKLINFSLIKQHRCVADYYSGSRLFA